MATNVKKDFGRLMEYNMKMYADEVNEQRAIPSIYDSLKPVQRKILYWLFVNKGIKDFRGGAEISGGVTGAYHPHSDTAVYGALARLSQPLIMNYPLVDFHGNNGSLTDPPAAPRYTKAKLSQFGLGLLEDIDIPNCIEWQDNYNETLKEPKYLLGTLGPLALLLNPSIGIGVGLASTFVCHNINDIKKVLLYRMKHPNCTFEELPPLYPSFHSGGVLINQSEIPMIYKTGRGNVVLRAKYHWEGDILYVTEFPYRVDSVTVRKYMLEHPIRGVSEIYEQNGTLKIYTESGINKEDFEKELLKKTRLQNSYAVNMTATDINGKPHLYTLLEILDTAIALQHRRLIKKAEHSKATYEHQLHINQGLAKALDIIDEVIEIIRNSDSPLLAETNLINRLSIDNEQAKAILDIRLARLSKMEVDDVRRKIEELTKNIQKEAEIIESSELREEIYQSELNVYTDNSPRTECFDYLTNTNSKYITEPGYLSVIDANTYIYSETIEDESYNISETGNGAPMPIDPFEEYFILTTKGRGIKLAGGKFLKGKNDFTSICSLGEKEYVVAIIPKKTLEINEYITLIGSDNKEYSLHKSFVLIGATPRGKKIINKKIEIKSFEGFSNSLLYAQLS